VCGARRLLVVATAMFFFPPLAPVAPKPKPAPASIVSSEPEELMSGGYSVDELQCSMPADQTAMLPYVDDDSEPTVAAAPKAHDPLTEIRAMQISASLVAYGALGNEQSTRAFIQELDAIDNPTLRAAVKAQYQTSTGQSLETFIRTNDDWNDGEDREEAAALQLIDDKRDQTQAEIAQLSPEEREKRQARANHIAAQLGGDALAHDDSTKNVAEIHGLLGGCDAIDTELVRSAIRRNFNGERNLYQLVDDGMDEADSDEQEIALAMLAGDRVHSAQLALAHESDKGDEADVTRLRAIVDRLSPKELEELDTSAMKYGVLGQIENPSDRAELQRRVAGDDAGADAERISNLLGFHMSEDAPSGLRGGIDEANNKRRNEDNVLAEIEGMSGPQVQAAAKAWLQKGSGMPFEAMIIMRWGDEPEVRDRLLAMIAGDKGKNRSLRFQQALIDDDQEALEASLARDRYAPEDLESQDPEVRARAEALRDEQASFEMHNEQLDGWRAELFDDENGARSTFDQLDSYYKQQTEEASEVSRLANFVPGGDFVGQKFRDAARDNRIGGREMLADGQLSIETRLHRADGADEQSSIAAELTSNKELAEAEARNRTKYGTPMLPSEPLDDLEDMTANELKLDQLRTLGVVADRPAQVQYYALSQLYAKQYSSDLESDEEDREGGGTQLGMRQHLDAMRGQLHDPQLAVSSTGDPIIDSALRSVMLPVTQLKLDSLGRDADDGLRDGAAPEEFAAIASSADVMLTNQRDAKKRLAERKAQMIAMVAKIGAALTANPWLVAAINLTSNFAQAALKSRVMGESYDATDDAVGTTVNLVTDSLGIAGAVTGREELFKFLGTTAGTVASGDIDKLGTAYLGAFVPGTLGTGVGGGLIGDGVEAASGMVIDVANGGDFVEAAGNASFGFGMSLAKRSFAGPESLAPEPDAPEAAAPDAAVPDAARPIHAAEDVRAGASTTIPDTITFDGRTSETDHRVLENTQALAKRADDRLQAMSPDERALVDKARARIEARSREDMEALKSSSSKSAAELYAGMDAIRENQRAQHVILERTIAAGHSADEVDTMEMMSHTMSAKEMTRELTGAGHLQHYQHSCVPASYQAAAADLSPPHAARLLNDPKRAMKEQRDVLIKFGSDRLPRESAENGGVFQAAMDDAEFAGIQTDSRNFSPRTKPMYSDENGVWPPNMIDRTSSDPSTDTSNDKPDPLAHKKLHERLESAAGVPYESIVNAPAPMDRVERAVADQRPVLIQMNTHELTIVGRSDDGEYIIQDTMSGKTSKWDAATIATFPFKTVTLPE
jgi:hypothetical protein